MGSKNSKSNKNSYSGNDSSNGRGLHRLSRVEEPYLDPKARANSQQ